MIVENYSPIDSSLYCKVTDFGDGEREVMIQRIDIFRRESGSQGELPSSGSGKNSDIPVDDEDHRLRSARRASKTVRHRVKAIQADRMLTLTYRANQTDWEQLTRDFKLFVRRMRKAFPSFEYVAVPERQKRGAWHMHIAIKGRLNAKIVRSVWLSVVREGNIDITNPYKYRRYRHKLAVYLSKYLSKAFLEGDLFMRRVWSSRGIKIPTPKIWSIPFVDWIQSVNEIRHYLVDGDELVMHRLARFECYCFYTTNRK